MNKSTVIAIIVGLGLIIPASLWYGQHNGLLPLAAATEADLYDGLFNSLLTIAVAIFLIVQAILIYSIVKFRRRKGDNTDGMAIHDNFLLEIIWTAVPTVLVIWVGIYSFDVYSVMQNGRPMSMGMGMPAMTHNHLGMEAANADTLISETSSKSDSDPQNTEPLNIDVQGMQFAWIFSYPNTEIQTSELHVPIGREIKLNLSAIDVIHAFWVPQFRLKQDTIPGMATSIQFTPNVLGTYPIVCAELCGSYHGGMRAEIFVETPEEYQAWLVQEQEDLASAKINGAIASNTSKEITSKEITSKEISNKVHSQMGHKQILAAQAQKMGIDAEMIKGLNHTAPHI